MSKKIAEEKEAVSSHFSTEDLSKEIEQSIEREKGEQIRTVRVFGDCYRCNWWVHDKMPQQMWLTTGKIIKSKLLRVTKANDKLLVENVGK